MDDHQHAAIEQARIACHGHQFEHDCYGRDCAEDRRLYRTYQRAIKGQFGRTEARSSAVRAGRFLIRSHA